MSRSTTSPRSIATSTASRPTAASTASSRPASSAAPSPKKASVAATPPKASVPARRICSAADCEWSDEKKVGSAVRGWRSTGGFGRLQI